MTNSAWSDFWSLDQNMCIQGQGSHSVNELIDKTWIIKVTNILEKKMVCFDLASGSGYLSNLISQHFANKTPLVFAYDYAKVNHRLYPPSVKVIDKQAIETITSTKYKADIVMSNFGFEYANIDNVFASMIQYTHKGTYVLLNCHHPDSIYSQDSRDIINAFQDFADSELVNDFYKLLSFKDPIQKKNKAMMFFKSASIIDIRNNNGLSKMQIVDMFLHFYKVSAGTTENLSNFNEAIKQQKNYITRLKHQLQAAQKYPSIIDHLNNHPSIFEMIKEQDINYDGQLISKFIEVKIK